jgi:hypothetical protein
MLAFKIQPTKQLEICWFFNPTSGNNNSVALTGLASNESIVGLDFRPANGGVCYQTKSRLFSVNTASGALPVIGSPFIPHCQNSLV